ncbi:MAG TPA: sigma-70 family RNA polymerase sigma factor [Planctomycetes bacterium]|nr:sigma-70 family RNA polymerase sigma factor [Fuerstiella sp.]HIK93601.1 sigma-70 family RNA polymerase sigma factor [Planctomycetota bacterium]
MTNSDANYGSSEAEADSDDSLVSQATDARLVEQARHGDTDAFGQLAQRYERRVIKVIRRFMPDQDMALDLAQDAFLKAFDRLDQFDPSRRFGPWLFRIAVNTTYDHLRKIKRKGKWALFSEAGENRVPDPQAPDPRGEIDLSQEVRTALEDIPETYRTVLVLRDLEGFSTSEVAAVTERSEATIRWRLAEARRMFKEAWDRRQRCIEEEKIG